MSEPARATGPWADLGRQREAARMGMLVFVASETMLFGGLIVGAVMLRILHPLDYGRAATHLHLWLGGLNTAVLLTSSLLVALALAAVREGRPRLAAWALAGAAALGCAFLAIKGYEYRSEYQEGLVPGLAGWALETPVQHLLMNLYFIATGLHGIHVTIGILLLLSLVAPFSAARRDRGAVVVGNAALYWHLVDIVWVFLYPTLYLARP